jgi:hypothetical protein
MNFLDKTLPCIICNRELENVVPASEGNQPYGGTAFFTHGHYGSTYFDPVDGTALEINLCDDCLRIADKQGKVRHIG